MHRLELVDPRNLASIKLVLQWRGLHQSERTAFIYLADGERETARLTYGDLDRRARSVAAWLHERGLARKPVGLFYRAGLDFVVGFLGCLYAGAIAVPAYPPHPRRADPRLQSILDDCSPEAAFCVLADHQQLSHGLVGRGLEILATDALPDQSDRWQDQHVGLDWLAHLQYTSGSTGSPKGVMVTHGNLLHQCQYVSEISRCDVGSIQVSWQPFFHDMGLIAGVVGPLFCGAVSVVMPPAAFLQSPIRWLRAISDHRGTGTSAPNFAYELCVKGITPGQREGLDLSTLEEVWDGAEPIRADTLDRFCETYAPYGFRRSALIPSYGMAETTLCTTASRVGRLPVVNCFRRDRLERGAADACASDDPLASRLVSSGIMGGSMEVAIVDPETLQRCPDGKVGEIWISGPSVAHGYWKRAEETERTFKARVAGEGDTPYLRSGDLGFLREGELYVTGRLKDIIIIRGRNVYPQDVELVAQRSHEALQIDACAAFSIEVDDREELAVAMEVKRSGRQRIDTGEVFEAVRAAIGEHFGVAARWLGLVPPGRLPKTSSGKVMRSACRKQQRSGELPLFAEWRARDRDDRDSAVPAAAAGLTERLRALAPADRHRTLVTQLQGEVARALELRAPPDPRAGFERLGLDSMGAVDLVNRVQAQLGGRVALPATLLFDQPNIVAVARYLEESLFGQPVQAISPGSDRRPLDEPVAVVGLACRFPGAADAQEFWQLLDEGRDAIQEIPSERWDVHAYFDPDPGAVGKMNSRFGGFISDMDGFDAAFFDIAPREATSMDPQHRQLLEVSWLALEDAGIAPSGLDGRPVGVFVGISTNDYEQILAGLGPETTDAFMATGNAHSAAVGRLSFALGLQGPCVAMDTACSSSLVAVHQAVQSLRQGECEMALAGGVNAVLRPELTVAFCKARLLSPDGRCRTFDAAADGYARSEGCGMVVLRRLSDALRDGDRILAVIRGSAVNQDGRSSGLTAPNGPSQTRVIASALRMANVAPARVQYLECHGTATVLGDPIEVQAANAILAQGRSGEEPLVIGSVKTNVGHLEAAAGIAGLIKVVLALQHDRIPSTLHFHTPNPHIPWASMPVRVAAQALPWTPIPSRTRIAGVSSFGFAGTNAHVVLEEAPREEAETADEASGSHPCLLAISARTQAGLDELAGRYVAWLREHQGAVLDDVCHTANTGRSHFEHRAVVMCEQREAALQRLDALARGASVAGAVRGVAPAGPRPRVAFLFPGQGLQYAGMARELYERTPAFRECLDRCSAAYDEFGRGDGSPPLQALMFESGSEELLKQTRYVQPALYALQVSLAALWRSWGVTADAVLGHSAGEYAAAAVAGVFRVEDGLRLIVERARLMQALPTGGTMLSVTAPAESVEAVLAGDESIHVSAYNGLNTVISGPVERLDALIERFNAQELYWSRLPASNAFHSPVVEPILDDFEACARQIAFSVPTAMLVSTLTGKPIGQGEIPDASYWRAQARRPVRFAQAIQALFEDVGCDVVLELGPQAELVWLAQMSWRPEHEVLWASSLAKGCNALEQMLTAAAQLHVNGVALDFAAVEARPRPYRKLALPSYPFRHERFWPGPMGGGVPSELHDAFYQVQWHGRGPTLPHTAAPQQQSWLVLADEHDVGAALADALRTHGQGPVLTGGPDCAERATDGIRAIIESARGHGALGHVVLVASPVDARDSDPDAMWDAQERGVVRALRVAQALLSTRGTTQLWLVTRGAQAVCEGDIVDPTHSAIWGFGRTFALEHPDRCGGLIDIALASPATDVARELAGALLSDDGEKQSALRNGQRWVPRLERYATPRRAPVEICANATYLIAGGTGALGLAAARHLARRGAGQIVLTSRSTADESARTLIEELGARGCRIEMIRADLSVRQEVERLMREIERVTADRPLRGIIFAAGTHAGAPILQQTPETMRQVLAPKISGAWNLHRLCLEQGVQLDLFVLFSSSASLLGSREHANYTASNAYLDSLAHCRRSLGLPALSINWGPWAGLGVAPQMRGGSWDEIGIRLIQPAMAMLAFDRLASGQDAQVGMQPMDLSRWSDLAGSGRIPPILLKLLESLLTPAGPISTAVSETSGASRPARSPAAFLAQLAQLGPIERGDALQAFIRDRVGAVLGIPSHRVDLDTGFFDMGMNSIMAVELRGALEARLGKLEELQAAVVFNHPTVRRLTMHLARALFPQEVATPLPGRAVVPVLPVEARAVDPAKLPAVVDAAADEILGAHGWSLRDGDSRDDAQLRKAFAAILALRAEVDVLRSRATEPIAIVGLSCRYPGADSAEAYWRVLAEGRDEIGDVPADRWDALRYYDSDPAAPGKMNSRRGGFITGIDGFDADFFGISPREARSLDPQQRLLLEVSWEALENANLAPRRLRDTRGGVFVGITAADYAQRVVAQGIDNIDAYAGTGNALCAAAGRLAFTLGWQGPALAIDTACSSSLVTLHEACSSLRAGECDVALAGGVNLLLDPAVSITLAKAHALSPDDRCKTFDASANGYVRSEGCGMVVAKRLSDARRDGDNILALIRGSAVNQDGRSSGLTVPNGLAQERVIADALKAAGVAPAAVQYLETHGTGTPLGDPIEVQAADAVLSQGRTLDNPLLIGSVKTNIGHTEAAAGVASVIKVVLALQKERLPRTLHFTEPNPHVPWERLKVKVTAEPVPWQRGAVRRIAGVSSFGFVGTNAHVVLEEAPLPAAGVETEREPHSPERDVWLLAVSARSDQSLADLSRRYLDWFGQHEETPVADVCHTANTGRDHFECRAGLVFDSREALDAQLSALARGEDAPGMVRGRTARRGERRIAFLYTGQGAQSVGMGRELYRTEPVFRECFDRCAAEFARIRTDAPDLRQLVFEEAGEGLIDQTGYTQPALYSLEVSLTALWRAWGVEPDVVLGHSVGEYAAACASGVFGLEDGLRLIAERGRLMQELPAGGSMAAVSAPAEKVQEALRALDDVCIGAYNGVDTVISGARDGIDTLIERFEAQGLRCRRLVTSHAFHSARMEPILDAFQSFARGISYRPAAKRLISNVTGDAVAEDCVLDAAYWTAHIRSPVQFERGVRALQTLGCDVLLELGPHPVLVGMGQSCWSADETPLWSGCLRRGRRDTEQMLTAAATMYAAGVDIDFAAMDAPWRSLRRKVNLPTYPFLHRRFWVEAAESPVASVGPRIAECLYHVKWEQRDAKSRGTEIAKPETWLVLADRKGAAAALCQQLEDSGRRFVCLKADDGIGDSVHALAEAIAAAGADRSAPLTHVVHMWSLDRSRAGDVAQLWEAQSLGVESVLNLVQALVDRRWQGRLWLVTSGVQRVRESDSVDASHGPIWGLGKAVGMERPELWGGLIDLPRDADLAASAASLLAVLDSEDAEDQVAVRDAHRWVARLERQEVPSAPQPMALDAGGTYLITGGLGGVGLEVAVRLAGRGARHLVLNGRRAPTDSASVAIAALERADCEVKVILGDVSQESDVARILDEIGDSALPPLTGIIHAAGVDALAALPELDREVLRRTLAPKLAGGWLLDRLTAQRGIELSLFLCTSSISSVWGSVGQGAYAAANAFLDALALQRQAQGRTAITINYGPWARVGMGTANEEGLAWLRSRGIRALDPVFALDAMEAAVGVGVAGTVVADLNWDLFRELAELQRPRPLLEKLGRAKAEEAEETESATPTALVGQLTAVAATERAGLLNQVVRTELARVLQRPVDELGVDVGFFDLGMDSLMAVEFRNALVRQLGRKLPATVVMDRPDIDSIVEYILTQTLGLSTGRISDGMQRPVGSQPDVDATEAEVRELSPSEVEAALADELRDILRA